MIVRIELAVENGISTVENIYPNAIASMAGEGFQPKEQWEILTPYKNALVQDNLTDANGFQSYDLIVYWAAREDNPNLAAT